MLSYRIVSYPSADAGRTEDREESGRWPFASHDDSDRRSTAGPYSDASSSALEVPGFPPFSDYKNVSGRRSPVEPSYITAINVERVAYVDRGC